MSPAKMLAKLPEESKIKPMKIRAVLILFFALLAIFICCAVRAFVRATPSQFGSDDPNGCNLPVGNYR